MYVTPPSLYENLMDESLRTQEYEIFSPVKISAITVIFFFFTDILAGFTFNNRVLRLPAIVLLNTTLYKWACLESLDVYPKKAWVSRLKRRVQENDCWKTKNSVFTDILAGFTFNNRVLRLPAIVLLNTDSLAFFQNNFRTLRSST